MPLLIEKLATMCRHSDKRTKALPRVLSAAGVFLFAVFSLSGSQSGEHRVDRISVLERGVFQANSSGLPVGSSSLGPVTKVRDVSLVQSTTTIHARKSLRFGLRYVITGVPAGAPVDIRLVTRFPEAGLLDPVSGVRHHQSEYTIQAVIGVPAYREFMFDRSWEIVSGEWVFEFWQANRNIGMQKFCVMDAESAPHQVAPLQSATCAFLIGGDVLNLHSAGVRGGEAGRWFEQG